MSHKYLAVALPWQGLNIVGNQMLALSSLSCRISPLRLHKLSLHRANSFGS
jgi:hypothetical protein